MRTCVAEKVRAFEALNDLSLKGEIVVLGSTYMAEFPFYELINRCRLENAVYNRSIEGLTVSEAAEILPAAVLELRPAKVFLCFDEGAEPQGYEALIRQLLAALPDAAIYLVGRSAGEAARLAPLCDGKRVRYVGLPSAGGYQAAFKRLCCFFRRRPIDMADAFAMAAL